MFWLEVIIVAIFLVIGFVISSSVFNIAGYEVEFEYTENVQGQERLLVADYHMPPIVGVQSEKNPTTITPRSEEHTSELQSRGHLVCRLLLEKKNKKKKNT